MDEISIFTFGPISLHSNGINISLQLDEFLCVIYHGLFFSKTIGLFIEITTRLKMQLVSLWPSDVKWHQRSGSTLFQVILAWRHQAFTWTILTYPRWGSATTTSQEASHSSILKLAWKYHSNLPRAIELIHSLRVSMMTSSNGNIFRVTGPLWGESTGHR